MFLVSRSEVGEGDNTVAIIVRQAAVGTLGRLAVMAGQARGRQLQAGRDIQFTQIALAAQDRAAAMRAAASDRAFAMQRAAATQIARQRPTTPDTRAQQQRLRQFVSEAEAADIYDPRQIKQMQIFADLGDERAVRSIAGQLPLIKPPARQKELMRQSRAFSGITQQTINPLQRELTDINRQISTRYGGATTQQWVEERPEVIPEKDRGRFQKLFARRRELSAQVSQVEQQAEQVQQRIQLGFTIPRQESLRLQQLTKKREAEIAAVKRIEKRNQRRIERQIAVEERQLKIDPYADPITEQVRVGKVRERIEKLEADLKASFAREDIILGGTPVSRRMTLSEATARTDEAIAEAIGDPQRIRRILGLPEPGSR